MAVGGGTKGGLWTQVVSNVVGRSQVLPAETVGASYGDAMLAGIAGELAEPGATWNSTAAVIEPDLHTRDIYEELYTLYRELYPATRSVAHSLADLQKKTPGI